MRAPAFFLLAAAAAAQPRPAFEAASLRPMEAVRSPHIEGGPGTNDPGRIRYNGITPRYLILEAYRIRDFQLVAPAAKALDSRGYELAAKLPAGATKADLRFMLQSLLAERFHLAVHREQREMQGYELTVAKGGPKLKPAIGSAPVADDFDPLPPAPPNELEVGEDGYPNVPPREGSWMVVLRSGYSRMRQLHASMADLAGLIANHLDRPVADATDLNGRYEFTLSWAAGVPSTGAEPAPDIFGALQQQLGLKLAPWRGPVDVIVVDRFDREPVAN